MARTLIASADFTAADNTQTNTLGFSQLTGTADTMVVLANKATAKLSITFNTYPTQRWSGGGTFTDNQYAKATVGGLSWAGFNSQVGVIVRASGDVDGAADHYRLCIWDDAVSVRTTKLIKMVNGTETTLDTRTQAWDNGDTIELEAEGTDLRAYRNGTLLYTVTDSSLTSGAPGMFMRGSSNNPTLEDWEGGNVSSPTGPTIDVQPTAQTADEGGTATFSVSSTTSGGAQVRQWKRQPPGGGAFSNVGTNSATYTTGALGCATDHGANFYCTVTDDNGPTDTATVGLTVRSVTTVSRPAADVTTTGWTTSTGSSFFALIDETSASDADYIDSPTITGTPEWITLGLQYPLATGARVVPVRASVSTGAGTLKVQLVDNSGTVVGSAADQAVTATPTTYNLAITISGPATRIKFAFI